MFEAAKFFQKSFFINNSLESVYEREQDSALKKMASEEKRLLYSSLRHALPLSYYLDDVYPKWRKKKNSLLGISFLFLALDEQIFAKKALYHTYQWLNKGLTASKTDWLKPIARSILEHAPKEKEGLYKLIDKTIRAHSYLAEILTAHPEISWPELFEHPPLWIRATNTEVMKKIKAEDIIEQRGLAAQIRQTSEITSDLFEKGLISFQNIASQSLSLILEDLYKKNENFPCRVIDTCAAPGGKSLILLEQSFAKKSRVELLITDLNSYKVEALWKNIQRVHGNLYEKFPGLKIQTHNWAEKGILEKADLILVDAPCSGSGVTRKHPDALWTGSLEKANALITTQYCITKSSVESLKNDGILIYTTCSIDPRENDELIAKILETHTDLQIMLCELAGAKKMIHGYQFLPNSAYDGFYVAILKKTQL